MITTVMTYPLTRAHLSRLVGEVAHIGGPRVTAGRGGLGGNHEDGAPCRRLHEHLMSAVAP